MSKNQRVAHVTGLNMPFVNTLGGAGSYFAPAGSDQAPGITGGLAEGFSVAFGIYSPAQVSPGAPFYNLDPFPLTPPPGLSAPPELELIASCFDDTTAQGWAAAVTSGVLNVSYQTSQVSNPFSAIGPRPDMIVLSSFVRDGEQYGQAPGTTIACIGVNGNMHSFAADFAAVAFVPGTHFGIGASDVAALSTLATSGGYGGLSRSLLNSFWITEGIPTAQQAQAFFRTSMQAGRVIPQPWAPARTNATPNPVTPSSATGHHWDATDVDISEGIGAPWVDRIGGVELQLTGTFKGTEREVARQGDFYFPNS